MQTANFLCFVSFVRAKEMKSPMVLTKKTPKNKKNFYFYLEVSNKPLTFALAFEKEVSS